MEIQLIALTIMANGAARNGEEGGVGMRKKSIEGRNEPDCVLSSQGPSEGDGDETD